MDPQRFFCWRDGWNLHPLMVHPRTVEPATYWTEEPSRPSQILKMSTSPRRYKPVWQFPDAGAALIAPLDSFERERLRADWGGSGGMYHDGREISHSLTMFNSAFQVRFVNLLHPPKIAINFGAIPGNWNYGNLTDQLHLGACLKMHRKIQWFKKIGFGSHEENHIRYNTPFSYTPCCTLWYKQHGAGRFPTATVDDQRQSYSHIYHHIKETTKEVGWRNAINIHWP